MQKKDSMFFWFPIGQELDARGHGPAVAPSGIHRRCGRDYTVKYDRRLFSVSALIKNDVTLEIPD
jgi:hypothetical protein